ncbi:hypothetical protein TraAM80_04310 [Trypanosoma rangeli]|uniref:Uncharacterized protein n=1 Tax=Trypanosoma rangeli TaxID=5698 RepID=A0A3R7MNS3_TRYRA|nr:uncharacterized protein TraAM80_04310 [Trypanosoma rangeli]RNF05843.1 hypothetical protein TraAM80_04310 [Trypanosoma rangeli]|eukprot:RNF05843.1 hypothetical protein TraAM80_04310 [Trypanosoma rangeli]
MMRRAPEWFTHGRARERFHQFWPWVLSSACAAMYFYNREPFDEMAGTVVSRVRRPLLKTMEWIELHDVDPETMALELPPDMIFGPLEFPKQMRFLLAALRADNELADGYLARVLVDHMDLSLDVPNLPEAELLEAGGKDLLNFAIDDFLGEGTRKVRKHVFFQPDEFLRLINFFSAYPTLTEYFVNQRNGVELVFRALDHSHDAYARVLALRSICLFCFTQRHDGDVERRILQANGVKQIVEAYKQSSGDPTDTRYITLVLSSIMRHYPKEGGKEFIDADGIQAAVNNLNISRYKGLPQHIRVLHDAQRLPPAALGKQTTNALIEDADFIPVAMGILDVFPEFYETAGDILSLIEDIVPSQTTPFALLEYRAMPILSKFFVHWKDDHGFQTDGTRTQVVRLFKMMLNDKTCQRCYDPSVASYELQECLRTAKEAIREEEEGGRVGHEPQHAMS